MVDVLEMAENNMNVLCNEARILQCMCITTPHNSASGKLVCMQDYQLMQ